MKGTVKAWNGHYSNGFIIGEDGNEYFLHSSEVISGSKKLNKGNIVKFDFIDSEENGKLPRAVNVRKIGHGPQHPFIKDLERLQEVVENADISNEDKKYKLRDINMLKAYFLEAEDIEKYPDVRKIFREKSQLPITFR